MTVEDHWAEGGLGEAVSARSPTRTSRPRREARGSRSAASGKPEECLAAAGIDAGHIAAAARRLGAAASRLSR